MKTRKKLFRLTPILCAATLLSVASSCSKNDPSPLPSSETQEVSIESKEVTPFEEGATLFDARIRSLNSSEYVFELYFMDFSGQAFFPTEFSLVQDDVERLYKDDGEGNDMVAGDLIYSSSEVFPHSAEVPYNEDEPLRSSIDHSLTSESFHYPGMLLTQQQQYNLRPSPPAGSPSAWIIPTFGWQCGAFACCCKLIVTGYIGTLQ